MSSKLTITLFVVFALIAIALAKAGGGGGHTGGGGGKGGGKGGDGGDHGGNHGGNSGSHDKCMSDNIASWCCVGRSCNAQHGQQMYNSIHNNCNGGDKQKMNKCFNQVYGNGHGQSGQYCGMNPDSKQNAFYQCYGGKQAWNNGSCCK